MSCKRMKPFDKLAKRLKDDLGIEVEEGSLKRTYAGRNMLSAGGWSWVGTQKGSPMTIGSIDTVANCISKKNKLVYWKYGEIIAERPSGNAISYEEFWAKYCSTCGTQRCRGVYDEELREGCKRYRDIFMKDK